MKELCRLLVNNIEFLRHEKIVWLKVEKFRFLLFSSSWNFCFIHCHINFFLYWFFSFFISFLDHFLMIFLFVVFKPDDLPLLPPQEFTKKSPPWKSGVVIKVLGLSWASLFSLVFSALASVSGLCSTILMLVSPRETENPQCVVNLLAKIKWIKIVKRSPMKNITIPATLHNSQQLLKTKPINTHVCFLLYKCDPQL